MSDPLRARALRMLARRDYSRHEIARKLAPYAESEDLLCLLLNDLSERHLLSDERYAESRWAARASRFGNSRLTHELRTRGVSEDIIEAAVATADSELDRARAVWTRKFGDRCGESSPGERARQIRFLSSRGFSGDTIRRLLRGDFESS
jgi:regulatory protein